MKNYSSKLEIMKGGEEMKKNLVITFVVVLLVGGVCFFTGIKYQQGKQQAGFRQFAGGQGIRTGQGNRQVFRPVNGEVIGVDEKSITVKLRDGSSKIVLLTETTVVNKSIEGSKTDLKEGEKVVVFGTENPDGSVTAQNIQIGQSFLRMDR